MTKRTNILTMLAVGAFSAVSVMSHGQYFVPPLADHYDYNGTGLPNAGNNVRHTSNYSIANIPTGFGDADVYIAGWSRQGGPSEVTYQFTTPGSPSSILYQGTIPLPNADEVSVGSVRMNSDDYILVAYLSLGTTASYRINLYRINNSTVTPISFGGGLTLSTNASADGRISMDCHRQYGVAVAYTTTAGIETRVATTSGGGLTMSAGVTLAGTFGNLSPDVAFSHFNGGMNLHYVYYNPSTYRITESVLDYNTVLTTTAPTTLAPFVEDINQLPVSPYNFFRYVRPVIDCPDHYDVDNWAYTYTYSLISAPNANGSMPTEGIFVRYVDYHSGGTAATVNVADGSLGNAPCLDYYPIFPVLSYGEEVAGYNAGQIHVAWFNQENPTQDGGMFVAVHMSEDGSSLLSMPDYLVIPNSLNSFAIRSSIAVNLYDYYISPIALSKNSDAMFNILPNYLYTTYLYEGAPYSMRLNHAFHEFGNNNAYKGSPAKDRLFTGHCSTPDTKQQQDGIKVHPNPFVDVAQVSFQLQEDSRIRLQLIDLVGRVVWQQEETAAKGTYTSQLAGLQKLPSGVYVLSAYVNGKPAGTQKVVRQP